jgi:Flp pilus assembly protein TadD
MTRLRPLPLPTLLRLLLPLLLWASTVAEADELSEVQRLQASGETAAALQKADQFLVGKPKDAPMRFVKGVILSDSKRSAEAIEVFRQLTEDYPDLPEPYNNLATLFAASGNYDGARAELEQALRANPRYVVARENLGDVYAMLASRAYAEVMKLEPGNVGVPHKLTLLRELLALRTQAPAGAASVASQ